VRQGICKGWEGGWVELLQLLGKWLGLYEFRAARQAAQMDCASWQTLWELPTQQKKAT